MSNLAYLLVSCNGADASCDTVAYIPLEVWGIARVEI